MCNCSFDFCRFPELAGFEGQPISIGPPVTDMFFSSGFVLVIVAVHLGENNCPRQPYSRLVKNDHPSLIMENSNEFEGFGEITRVSESAERGLGQLSQVAGRTSWRLASGQVWGGLRALTPRPAPDALFYGAGWTKAYRFHFHRLFPTSSFIVRQYATYPIFRRRGSGFLNLRNARLSRGLDFLVHKIS